MDSFGQSLILEEMQNQSKHSNGKHNISDGRLENLACASAKKKYGPLLDLKRLKEKSISIHLFIFNSDTFACVGLENTFQQSAPDWSGHKPHKVHEMFSPLRTRLR